MYCYYVLLLFTATMYCYYVLLLCTATMFCSVLKHISTHYLVTYCVLQAILAMALAINYQHDPCIDVLRRAGSEQTFVKAMVCTKQ